VNGDRPSELPALVLALRRRLGLSQQQLAVRLQVAKLTVLRWELGRAQPSTRLRQRLEQIDEQTRDARAGDRAASQPVPPPGNLPAPANRLIGREVSLAGLVAALEHARLITLTGPGGGGKTRLALAAALAARDTFPDGAFLVELGALTTPALLPQAIAATLKLREQPGTTLLSSIIDTLRSQRLLLVLDNCEHLLADCATLAHQLIAACPSVVILATSREALAVAGEVVRRVEPLLLPDASQPLTLAAAERAPAVQLFVERAAARRAGFRLSPENFAGVARICRGLDGLPLAIELAAARESLLSIDQIAVRLDDRFSLLTLGARTAPPRQQTLLAAIDWSYALLHEREQALFRWLSVFPGDFDLEAAVAVGGTGAATPSVVLDLLGRLIEQSLVVMEEQAGAARYLLLESLRAFGRERLVAAHEQAAALGAHAAYCLAHIEALVEDAEGAEQPLRLRLLEREQGNIRAALTWYAARGESEAYLRLAAAGAFYWLRRGALSEGRQWLAAVHTLRTGVGSRVRARALAAMGQVAQQQGDLDEAETCFQTSLERFRDLDDRRMIGLLLNSSGSVAGQRGDLETQLARLRESASVLREAGVFAQAALPLINLGLALTNQQQYATARDLLEEALAICREGKDARTTGTCLNNLGALHLFEGRLAAGCACYEEALALRRELGDPIGMGVALSGLATAALLEGEYTVAQARLTEALMLVWEAGQRPQVIDVLELMLYVAVAVGAFELAARLIGSTAAQRRTTGLRRLQGLQSSYDQACTAAAAALGETRFAALQAAGAALSLAAAVAYARSTPELGGSSLVVASTTRPADLTDRELEVLQLVATGASNRAIAAALVLSLKTVERHISNIYAKLGVHNRVAASSALAAKPSS